jgi:type IV pilus assembly protein PilA
MRMSNSRKRRGFSLIELLIVISIILIIVMVALPKFNNALKFAHEAAAIKAIQTIQTVQVQYNSQYGRFANSLAELGPPASGGPTAAAADLIHSDLAQGETSGYKFTLNGAQGGYAITAAPVSAGSGNRTFYSDQNMAVREATAPEQASATSKEVNSAASKDAK